MVFWHMDSLVRLRLPLATCVKCHMATLEVMLKKSCFFSTSKFENHFSSRKLNIFHPILFSRQDMVMEIRFLVSVESYFSKSK